jgi:RNA polymerase sigma-70 factor (ECF subfamily)
VQLKSSLSIIPLKSLIITAEETLLLEKIRADPNEFGVLFEHYYNIIFYYNLIRNFNYDHAGDIAAETFLKAFLKINDFKWRNISISSWLFKIATNEINYYYRKDKYSPGSLDLLLDRGEFDIVNTESFEEERARIEEELKSYDDLEA